MSEDFLPRCELLIEERTARRDFNGTDILIGVVVVIDGKRVGVSIPKEAWIFKLLESYKAVNHKNMSKRGLGNEAR